MNVDWTNIPIGVGIAVLLVREASRFIQERERQREQQQDHRGDRVIDGNIGSRSVEFWEAKQREIVYTEIDRHVMPKLDELGRKLTAVHDNVRELRWRSQRERKGDSGPGSDS